MNNDITNAEIMRKLITVDDRAAKLLSDVNDIKVVQATDHARLENFGNQVEKISHTVYGNSSAGLVSRIARLEDKEVVTWKDTAKELLLPLALGFLGFVLGNLS